MTHHELRLFLHLSRTLHFGQTSRECFVSPSTLSRIIQRLEEEAGESLFERDRREVLLTRAGEVFQRYAEKSLADWDAMQGELRQQSGRLEGEISLFCTVTACYSILPSLLEPFRKAYPGIQIKLRTGDAAEAIDRVLSGDADFTVAGLAPDRADSRLCVHTITDTHLVFIAPADDGEIASVLRQRPVPWDQVPMIFPESGIIKEHLIDWFEQKGVTPQVYGRVSGHEAILALVGLGLGVGVVPKLVLDRSPFQTRVRRINPKPALPDFRVALCVREARLTDPLVNAFWETTAK